MKDKKVDVVCGACGKRFSVNVSDVADRQIVRVVCSCGAQTDVAGSMREDKALDILNELIGKVPPIIKEIREARMLTPETGMWGGVAEAAKKMTIEVLNEDKNLRAALMDYVKRSLRVNLLGEKDDLMRGAEERDE